MIWMGTLAFAALFLGDWNDWKWGRKPLRLCFPAGCLLLLAATVTSLFQGTGCASGPVRGLFWLLAAAFLALEADALFFALPRAASYGQPGRDRATQTAGMYALCRHPGVLWLAGLFLCLWPLGLPLGEALLYSVLNLLLAAFEDCRVFPARLTGYDAYRRETPFLLPTPASVRRCFAGGPKA